MVGDHQCDRSGGARGLVTTDGHIDPNNKPLEIQLSPKLISKPFSISSGLYIKNNTELASYFLSFLSLAPFETMLLSLRPSFARQREILFIIP